MSINSLTGSESSRFNDINDHWLIFEPLSSDIFSTHDLFTVPIGRTYDPEMTIDSASVEMSGGAILIEKELHRFFNQADAEKFIQDKGFKNIISVKEISELNSSGIVISFMEVQTINTPKATLDLNLLDFESKEGFFLEIYKSGSLQEGGVKKIFRDIKFDKFKRIVSDTYLKFFEIKEDA